MVLLRKLTKEMAREFEIYLYEEERNKNTTPPYLRNLSLIMEWLNGKVIDEAVALAYKMYICERYAPPLFAKLYDKSNLPCVGISSG